MNTKGTYRIVQQREYVDLDFIYITLYGEFRSIGMFQQLHSKSR